MLPDLPKYRYGALSSLLSGVALIPKTAAPKCDTDDFVPPKNPENFCARWSANEILQTLNDTGCIAHWKNQGFHKIWLSHSQSFNSRYELRVLAQTGGCAEMLMQIIVWLEYAHIAHIHATFPVFCVEHLRLQNPNDRNKPQFYGQNFPSSGLLRKIFGIIGSWAASTGAALITEIPEFFNTAWLFNRFFAFVDPEMAAIFNAMLRDLMPRNDAAQCAEISTAFEEGRILCNGNVYLWPTELQAFPIHSGSPALNILKNKRLPAHGGCHFERLSQNAQSHSGAR